MNPLSKKKSFTLIELIIGMAVLGIIILAISQLDLFSNANLIYSQRRIDLTNEASIALEHITNHLSQAIGSMSNPPNSLAVSTAALGGDRALRFWTDSNTNFMRDAGDRQSAYRWVGPLGVPQRRYVLFFCENCQAASNCVVCNGPNDAGPASWGVAIARNVNYFGKLQGDPGPGDIIIQDSCARVEIHTCSNPSAANCNTPNNPQVEMQAIIRMPGFSGN